MFTHPQTSPHKQVSGLVRLSQAEVDLMSRRHEALWAAEPGGQRAIFANCDLSGLDLSNRPLMDADFSGAVLAEAKMDRALLDKAQLTCAVLDNAHMRGTSLRHGNMRGASLRHAILCGADLFEVDLGDGALPAGLSRPGAGASSRTEAAFADLTGADLTRAKLTGINAHNANFSSAILQNCRLARANLEGTRFDFADLAGADLSGARLTDASLRRSILDGARLEHTDLTGARLEEAVFALDPENAKVAQVELLARLEAHISWVVSGGVEGTANSFRGEDLRPLGSQRGRNLSAFSAPEACLYQMDFEGAVLAGADLRGADLRCCNLRDTDLRGARLQNAQLDGCFLEGANLGELHVAGFGRLCADLTGASLGRREFQTQS